MSDINTIINLRNNHDKSINSIRKELGIDWRTAKKYADGEHLPEVKIKKQKGMMHEEEGKWGNILKGWLSEDALLPRKKRRTNVAYHTELVELGFEGSYRTVCNFIQLVKGGYYQDNEDAGYDRLEHPPAEAQVDFGTMEVEHEGSFKDVKVLLLTFAYSNAGFAVALPSENAECLLIGLTMIFKQIGGVPKKIRIDNMTTAVITPKTKFEEARLTDTFLQFANHHRFEVQVCNPRSGHEKGNVENKVGYIRSHFFVSTPRMVDYETFNDQLHQQLLEDLNRPHYEKQTSQKVLFEEERSHLLPLPDSEYPVFKEIELKANKYNEVVIDQTKVHIPRVRNHTFLKAVLRWDSYEVMNAQGEVIDSGFRPYMDKKRDIPWVEIVNAWCSKTNVVPYSRYFKYLPDVLKVYLDVEFKERFYRVKQLSKLVQEYSMKEIGERFYELIGADATSEVYDVNWNSYDSLVTTQTGGVG